MNQDFMDFLNILSLVIGVANYNENLSQSDKDDIMQQVDNKTKAVLDRIEEDLEYQNKMLEEMLDILHRMEV